MTDNVNVGAAIRETIEERLRVLRMRPADLARVLGMRPQAISKWTTGENTPPPGRWPALEDALGLPHGYFAEMAGLVDGGGPATANDAALRAVRARIEEMRAELSALLDLVDGELQRGKPRRPSTRQRSSRSG